MKGTEEKAVFYTAGLHGAPSSDLLNHAARAS